MRADGSPRRRRNSSSTRWARSAAGTPIGSYLALGLKACSRPVGRPAGCRHCDRTGLAGPRPHLRPLPRRLGLRPGPRLAHGLRQFLRALAHCVMARPCASTAESLPRAPSPSDFWASSMAFCASPRPVSPCPALFRRCCSCSRRSRSSAGVVAGRSDLCPEAFLRRRLRRVVLRIVVLVLIHRHRAATVRIAPRPAASIWLRWRRC